MMLVHIRKYHMNKHDEDDLAMMDVGDVADLSTLDDNLDNVSEASIESGEILQEGDQDMVSL